MRRKTLSSALGLILCCCLCATGYAQSSLPLAESGFTVAAKAAILLEPESGIVLYSLHEQERLPPASITKVMTMLLIMEAVDSGRTRMDEPITTSAFASGIGGSQVYLKQGETFPLRKMLIAIAVESANDASTAVAEHLFSTEDDFVRLMNTRARQLDMRDTHFTNAHGLPDPNHYMSAADIAAVTRELIVKHPRILNFTSIWTYNFRPGITVLRNTNELIHVYRGADGLKTGHTEEAGWCLVGTAKRGGMRLLSVVLGIADNTARLRETKRLLDYGFRNYSRKVVAKAGEELGRVAVKSGWPGRIRVAAPREIVTVYPRGKYSSVGTRLVPKPGLRAPVERGAVAGELEILRGKTAISRQPVIAAQEAGKASFVVMAWRTLIGWIGRLFGRK